MVVGCQPVLYHIPSFLLFWPFVDIYDKESNRHLERMLIVTDCWVSYTGMFIRWV
jgi:hypothetical protein